MIRIQEILDKVAANNNDADLELIQKAYVFAATAHAGQTRLSGEPYLSHPLAVADTLAEMGFDEPTVVAGLLHDTVEDTKATLEEIEENFGEEVADIVDGVTKISKISFENKEEAQAENIRKMILAMSHDMRVLMVKLADRLHNMRTLDFQKAYKQKRIAQETMDIYAPLANRLGLYIMKRNLEDLSFKYLRPDIYNQIDHWLDKHQVVEKQIIEKVVALIKDLLAANDIIGQVYGRIKHKYSIYKKMQSQSLTLDEMHDIMAFRVLVKDIRDCYAVLGLVHSQWRPVHGRFKDYISMPKANGYQSLHTTVIGPDGERIEIQIRTEDMHRQAEHGVAAHWLYKEKGRVNSKDLEQFAWLREIFERQSEESDSREFMHSLKMDLFKDEVYVYTPAGDVKELPEGATPLDFAFMIHTNVGQHCAGAKINGRLMPLGTELKNGDVVEIVTDPSRNPNRDWLKIVKTARARSRIQRYLRTEERSHAVTLGRDLLEKEGRKVSINVGKTAKEGQLALVAQEMNFDSVDDLVAAVGYAHLTPRKVLNRLYAVLHPEAAAAAEPAPPSVKESKEAAARKTEGVGISGVDGVLMRFAKCCNPVPGDPIIGYISRGLGISVHRADCPNVANMEPERLISVHWDGMEEKPYEAGIFIIAKNEQGVLATVAQTMAKNGVNITGLNMDNLVDGRAKLRFTVEVRDATQLYQLIEAIRSLPAILEVVRDAEDA
ncbi:RelA/SpoT family protein [Desulfovibrio legallii]|uniref:Bifunctional (P)ppGpp synthetase/guanosine-3',5'-bis(Diphosphate) 3'-pyrophosphohydrolase n=1 Tax=Desulfovibrio legallii TaxID=571438 RepID=A0A6H3FBQ7_9BACT|nr:bifunctional (p)ppGpp synthetase/guanosine-3',5'-bis(diphosphate) 3'-pyrophosphohydrolase [Desulfovibrio legallii]RHH25730.1 bifunctional (p)ppGpp synthetase/guanosine-3',5'-bis(diphosphate) 3'-pyrophosphohydrolase [Desulfovibrio sp. AM18-2]TBH79913.1 bifunctional (p)ppGpp synthetase/guanosine-3',5'-bis(diphosphate) 3'-pyrophosphohydrolase [Desulfovibrio legallii]CAI3221173.1 Guanosine-3',5'-bis(diphosphate) 3'-pyrophosphohydrolase (EC / GTP pyrophosphokinase (EC, (p)ppGpp synthetase II [Desu